MLVLETIDLNGVQSFKALTNKLKLNNVLPSNVIIWKLRNNNPMRKSYNNKKISLVEFDALTKLVSEMSKYLYPYIREILQSRDNLEKYPIVWNDFKTRFLELGNERLNTNRMKVKRLLDPTLNDEIITKYLLTLALCVSDTGNQKLKTYLLNT